MKRFSYFATLVLLMFLGCSTQESLEQRMGGKLAGNFRESYHLYPVSDWDVIVKTNPTSDPLRFKATVTLSAFGVTSEELPYDLWADGTGKNYEDLHGKCTLPSSESKRILQSFFDEVKLATGRGSSEATSSPDKTVPTWIYGTWSITTPYGTETMKLEEGGTIIDMVGMEMQFGTFTYEDGELLVKFPNSGGVVFTYELDLAGHRISIGEGQYMHKKN